MSEITDPAVAEACAFLQGRSEVGLKKYGQTVADSPDDMLQHALEEAGDLLVYLTEVHRRREAVFSGNEGLFKGLMAESEKLKRDVAVLREALGKVQWAWDTRYCAFFCECCKQEKRNGHLPQCVVGKALAATEPKEEA